MAQAPKGEIEYAAVARTPTTIFAETSGKSEIIGIAKRVLESTEFSTDTKKTYTYQGHSYNHTVADGVCFMCVAPESFQRRVAFAFLERIRAEYMENHKDKKSAGDFKKFLEAEKKFFSENPSSDKINQLQQEVDQVKSIMIQNIDKTLQRGAKLQDIDTQANELAVNTQTFKKKTVKLKCALLKKNVKLTMIIVGCCLLIILIIALSVFFSVK
eukprot:TRINITY_DN90_c0_g1_i1.p1 TRINITY_DN90_c0_g1~~TRINITY_DN90_c0_g1_i1.p1  ORF type:complete len:214 (-),score=70.14 TRINITY_DN90_c0_g1_i1:225-866(-)